MSTETQISANRLNAQKSTGPKTPEGKAKVAQNAVTHGLTASRPILDTENSDEYTLFRDDFFRHHAPIGILEESLAQRAADTFWRLLRAQDYETLVLNNLIQSAQNPDNTEPSQIENAKSLLGQALRNDFEKTHILEKVQKYEMSIERSYYRTLKELHQLQSLRLSVGEASVLHNLSTNSKNEQNKPKIPSFDPIKLLENMKTNPMDLDPLTKIMMKKDNFRPSTKKAM